MTFTYVTMWRVVTSFLFVVSGEPELPLAGVIPWTIDKKKKEYRKSIHKKKARDKSVARGV